MLDSSHNSHESEFTLITCVEHFCGYHLHCDQTSNCEGSAVPSGNNTMCITHAGAAHCELVNVLEA